MHEDIFYVKSTPTKVILDLEQHILNLQAIAGYMSYHLYLARVFLVVSLAFFFLGGLFAVITRV